MLSVCLHNKIAPNNVLILEPNMAYSLPLCWGILVAAELQSDLKVVTGQVIEILWAGKVRERVC